MPDHIIKPAPERFLSVLQQGMPKRRELFLGLSKAAEKAFDILQIPGNKRHSLQVW